MKPISIFPAFRHLLALHVVGVAILSISVVCFGHAEPGLLMQKILKETVTKEEVVRAFENPREDDLATTASYLIRARGNQEIMQFLREVWQGNKNKYPSLAWQEIEKPRVRLMIAQTLAQVERRNREYYEYIKSNLKADNQLIKALASLALGVAGSDQDISALLELAKSPSAIVSVHAIQGLGALGTERSREALLQLKAEIGDDPVKQEAITSALALAAVKRK